MKTSLLVLSVCALGATLATAAARGAKADEPPAVTVSYQDLDLRKSIDARVLYARLKEAATRVCLAVPPYDLARFAAYERCVNAALAQALQAIEQRQPGLHWAAGMRTDADVAAR